MKNPIVVLIVIVLLAGALALYFLTRASAPPPQEETLAGPEVAAGPPEGVDRTASAPPAGMREEAGTPPPAPPAPPAATVEGMTLPAGYPRSAVPHRVVKAWGRNDDGSPKRAIGMSILVDPATSDAQLIELAKDVLAANCDAPMMSVRIFDSAVAFDSEKYKTHDPIIAEHTIGNIWVNANESRYRPKVRVKIRGNDALVGAEAMDDLCGPAS